MKELLQVIHKTWPEKMTVDWRRLSSGLWRVPEGDISAAYCAETFPKVKTFVHEGAVFTNCGGHFSGVAAREANCHPLIPAREYRGPEPRRYTYEGREAFYRGRSYILGGRVAFVATDPTVEEWRQLLRVLYADGGMFACQASYGAFLADDRHRPNTENELAALNLELANGPLGLSKEEMSGFLDGTVVSSTAKEFQLDFLL